MFFLKNSIPILDSENKNPRYRGICIILGDIRPFWTKYPMFWHFVSKSLF